MTLRFTSLLFLLVSTVGFAKPTPKPRKMSAAACGRGSIENLFSPELADLVGDFQSLEKRYIKGRPMVTEALKLINSDAASAARGKKNFGVYRVETWDERRMVLKISDARSFNMNLANNELPYYGDWDPKNKIFNEYVAIHDLLGREGLAPKLYGVIPNGELGSLVHDTNIDELMRQGGFNTDAAKRAPKVGILMEEVGNGWAVSREVPLPPFLKTWTTNDVHQAIQEMQRIEDTCNKYHIIADDPQMIVHAGGLVWLIDLDAFRFDSTHTHKENLAPQILRLINGWEKASGGHKFPASEKKLWVQRAADARLQPLTAPPPPRPSRDSPQRP